MTALCSNTLRPTPFRAIGLVSLLLAAVLAGASVSAAASGSETRSGAWGFGLKTTVGSGKSASERRAVDAAFSKIDLQDGLTVDIRRGPAVAIDVTADDNVLPLIETKVKDGVLIARVKPNTSLRTRSPMKVSIETPQLESLRVQDGVRATVDVVSGAKVSLKVNDGATLNLASLDASVEIDVGVTDGAVANIATLSRAPVQRLRVSDGARLEVRSNLAGGRAVAKVSDGARLVLRDMSLSDFDLKASDGASVSLAGSSKTQVYLLQDGASLNARELSGDNASVLASDSSAANLGKLARIEVALADGATVRHVGDADVTVRKGKRSQVRSY